jgi:hypothetical protein
MIVATNEMERKKLGYQQLVFCKGIKNYMSKSSLVFSLTRK